VYILAFYFIFWIKCNKVHIPADIMTRLQAAWPRSWGLTLGRGKIFFSSP
jgi:hypothetical protein